MTQSLIDAALAYAAKGWPIVPVRQDKTPYTTNGVMDATTDPAQIEAWWARWPRAGIALNCGAANMMVVDFDPGHTDPKALDLPETQLRQTTPRGGFHLFYALNEEEVVSPSVSKLAPHVDVRSFNSYVLLPPSSTPDGVYAWSSEGKPAYRTDEMVRLANSHREKHEDRDRWLIEADLPENVEAATRWLQKDAKIAIEGQGGDMMAYTTAAHLKSYGVSRERAMELMWEHWNPRCDPPWHEGEYEHMELKVFNAYTYSTSPPGNITAAYRKAVRADAFKPIDKPLPSGWEGSAGRFRMVDYEGAQHIAPPSWIMEDVIADDSYSLMFGAPGSLKSFIALDIAMSIATGFPVRSAWPQVHKPGPVLYTAGEGRPGMANRMRAWSETHFSGMNVPGFVLADPVPTIIEDLDPYLDLALRRHPEGYRLVVIDTVARSMQGHNENAQEHASQFTALVDTLRRELGCSVLAIHHSGHGDQSRGKGSMEFVGAPDVVYGVERPDKTRPTVTVKMAKDHKDAEPWEKPMTIGVMSYAPLKTLTLVPHEGPAPETVQLEKVTARNKHAPGIDPVLYGLVDKAMLECTKTIPSRWWNSVQLAGCLRREPYNIDFAEKQLTDRVFRTLRDNRANRAFDLWNPDRKEWKYTKKAERNS